MATGYPNLAQVRAWLAVPAALLPDDQLQAVLDAETQVQALECRVPADPEPLPAELFAAIFRRCARHVAAKGVPLGMTGGEASEFGPARLPSFDAEIERLEGRRRKVVFG
jgi:hypothetical protein